MKRCPYCGTEYTDEATECAMDRTLFNKPQAESKPSSIDLKRLWTPYLILCSIGSGYGVLSYLGHWQHMDGTFRNLGLPGWTLRILRLVVFLRPLSIVAIWWNSRSGVVAYIALSIVSICVCLAIGLTIALVGIIGFIIFIILVRPKWGQMIWAVQMPVDKNEDT